MEDVSLLFDPQPLPGQTREAFTNDFTEGMKRLGIQRKAAIALLQARGKERYEEVKQHNIEVEKWEASGKIPENKPRELPNHDPDPDQLMDKSFTALADFKRPYHRVNTREQFLLWLDQWINHYTTLTESIGQHAHDEFPDETRDVIEQAIKYADGFGIDRSTIGVYVPTADSTNVQVIAMLDKIRVGLKIPTPAQGDGVGSKATPKNAAGFLSPARLAELNGLNTEAVSKRLRRWSKKHDGGWFDVPNPGPNEPKILFDAQAVQPEIDAMKARQSRRSNMSGHCPAQN